jgi:hypothetical protein
MIEENKIKLRTLTEKSILVHGKYKGLTVGNILKTNPYYLRYIYYAIEKISFCDDILKKIDIPYTITKPGVDLNYKSYLVSILSRIKYDDWSKERVLKFINARKLNGQEIPKSALMAYYRKKHRIIDHKMDNVESKISLMHRNHGHK